MIPNVSRGGRMGGLLAYLAGPGRDGGNEHVDPHLVAGDAGIMLAHGTANLNAPGAQDVARLLDHPRIAFGTSVTVPDRRGPQLTMAVAEPLRLDAHVWHCSLSLHRDEGTLSDEKWADIAARFVAKMGFADPTSEDAPSRWVALRHGQSKLTGNDHVHVVVSLVREDGSKANVWNDRPRAQAAAGELEREFGLRVLESREAGRGARASRPAEREAADRRGASEIDRDRLERVVRACAVTASDEAEFVRGVVQAGVRIRPRYATGRTDVVEGYSVALRARPGASTHWYGGGRLGRDLTLPRLRKEWSTSPEDERSAVAAWNGTPDVSKPVVVRVPDRTDPELLRRCTDDLAHLRHQLRSVPPGDQATWARVAHDASGVFAAWSLQVERRPGALAATSRALARSAEIRARDVRPRQTGAVNGRAAALLLPAAAHRGKGTTAEVALLIQLTNTIKALHDAHRAAGELQLAAQLNAAVREHLLPVVAPGPAAQGPHFGSATVVEPRPPGAVTQLPRPGSPQRPSRRPRESGPER